MPRSVREKTLRELSRLVEHPRVGEPTLRRVIEELRRRKSPSAAVLAAHTTRLLKKLSVARTNRPSSSSVPANAQEKSAADELEQSAESLAESTQVRLQFMQVQLAKREVTIGELERRAYELEQALESHIESQLPEPPKPTRWGGSLRIAELWRAQMARLREEASATFPRLREIRSIRERLDRMRRLQATDEVRCSILESVASEAHETLVQTKRKVRQMRVAEAAERESRRKTATLMASLRDENALVLFAASLLETGRSELNMARELRSRGAEDPAEILVRARLYKRHSEGNSR